MRIAFIVSHPIQYYVPLYRELARLASQRTTGPRDHGTAAAERRRVAMQPTDTDRKGEGGIKHSDDCQPSLRDRPVAAGQLILIPDDSARISALKVFYTWRDAGAARDVKFGKEFAWDIPLMEGYDFEVVPNASPDPGTHHRKGLINPDLVERVKAWKPDVVHITGYNYVSHGQAIKELSKAGIPVIFRGDSHLLDGRGPWWKWWLKKSWLSRVYSWPTAFTYVGQANHDYYRSFGVPERKLFPVPHTIEVGRFAEPNEELEAKALAWRRELGIPDDHFVFLYAAKLEPRKRPMELLEAFLRAGLPKATLLFVGSGELERTLKERAREGENGFSVGRFFGEAVGTETLKHGNTGPPVAEDSARRVVFVPFQNQSQMPVVYRLGDALVLPSGYGETWGLAVNEAQACGRPALVSDCVGCARDIIREGENGMIFRTDDWEDCVRALRRMAVAWSKEANETKRPKDEEPESAAADVDSARRSRVQTNETSKPKDEESNVASKREGIRAGAWEFDTTRGADALLQALGQTV